MFDHYVDDSNYFSKTYPVQLESVVLGHKCLSTLSILRYYFFFTYDLLYFFD